MPLLENQWIIFGAAMISAFLQALSNVMQQRALYEEGVKPHYSPAGIARWFKRPLWDVALLIMFFGFGFQALALVHGKVMLVQLVMVTILVWVLPFAVIIGKAHLTKLEYLGSAPVLVGFIIFAWAVHPSAEKEALNYAGWGIACACFAVAIAVLILISRHIDSEGVAAALLGSAGGLINGLGAGLLSATLIAMQTDGLFTLVHNWLLYAMAAAMIMAIIIPAWAFEAGPVTASVPPLTVLNPIAAMFLGVGLLGEGIAPSTSSIIWMVAGGLFMIGGVVALSRSKVIAKEFRPRQSGIV